MTLDLPNPHLQVVNWNPGRTLKLVDTDTNEKILFRPMHLHMLHKIITPAVPALWRRLYTLQPQTQGPGCFRFKAADTGVALYLHDDTPERLVINQDDEDLTWLQATLTRWWQLSFQHNINC